MSEAEPGGGASGPSFEDRAAFLLRLREGGIRDLAVLRAMEAVPRAAFVAERFAALAFKDIALPAGRGQSVPPPLVVARLLAGARLDPSHAVLLIGLGAGYTTAVLSHLVARIVAVERLPSLIPAAARRLEALGCGNVELHCADGLAFAGSDLFDRILVLGAIDRPSAALWDRLKPDGAIVHARNDDPHLAGQQFLVRVEKQIDGIGRQAVLGASRLGELRPGIVSLQA